MNQTTNRLAVVTGGAGGIGAACAARLAADGFDVVVVDVKPADEIEARVRACGRRFEFLRCDITVPGNVEGLQSRVAELFGRCDVLINNAGFYSMVPLESLTFDIWRRYMSLNLDAAFLMSRAFAPLMRARRHGRIISMASNSFFSHVPGMIAYMASKGGLIGMTRGLASELGGEGITANLVAPGPILTDQLKAMLPRDADTSLEAAVEGFFTHITATQAVKRMGMPTDVAEVVSFLAGEGSAFVTGQTIVVDGGCVRL